MTNYTTSTPGNHCPFHISDIRVCDASAACIISRFGVFLPKVNGVIGGTVRTCYGVPRLPVMFAYRANWMTLSRIWPAGNSATNIQVSCAAESKSHRLAERDVYTTSELPLITGEKSTRNATMQRWFAAPLPSPTRQQSA
jgi:hypothetical protein